MKRSNLKSYPVILMLIAIISIIITSTAISPISNVEAYSYLGSNYSSNITVRAYNHEGGTQTPNANGSVTLVDSSSTSTPGYAYQSYSWKDIRNFEITFNIDSLPDDAEKYNYGYTVSWTPQLITNGKAEFDTEHTITAPILINTATSKDDIVSKINFMIDDNTMESTVKFTGNDVLGDDYILRGGWGLYIFSFEHDGVSQSAIFELRPEDVNSLPTPEITYEKVSSNEGINDAFLFKLNEEYKYINREQIKWYVTGTAKDGRKFVLTPSDVTSENVENTIYGDDSIIRTSYSFKLDTKIEGTWQIKCEIFDQDCSTLITTVTGPKVSTVVGYPTQTIIWIVVSAAVVAAIIVTVVIVLSIKKEKVY